MQSRDETISRLPKDAKTEYEIALRTYIDYVKGLSVESKVASEDFVFIGVELRETLIHAESEYRKDLMMDRYTAQHEPDTASVDLDTANNEYLKHNVNFMYLLLQAEHILISTMNQLGRSNNDKIKEFKNALETEIKSIEQLTLNAHKYNKNLRADYQSLFKDFNEIAHRVKITQEEIDNLKAKIHEKKTAFAPDTKEMAILDSMNTGLETATLGLSQTMYSIAYKFEVTPLDELIIQNATEVFNAINNGFTTLIGLQSANPSDDYNATTMNHLLSRLSLTCIIQSIINGWSNFTQEIGQASDYFFDAVIKIFQQEDTVEASQTASSEDTTQSSLEQNAIKDQLPAARERNRMFSHPDQTKGEEQPEPQSSPISKPSKLS